MTKPDALELADRLEGRWPVNPEMEKAAAELRRLHAEVEALKAESIEQCKIIGGSAETELRLRAEVEALRGRLGHIAAVAHQGGLAGHDSITALACVRQLTLPYWDKTGTQDAMLKRVLDAASEAMKEKQHG